MFIKFLEWIFSSWYKPNHQHQTAAAVHSSSKNRSIVVFPMPNYHATFKDAYKAAYCPVSASDPPLNSIQINYYQDLIDLLVETSLKELEKTKSSIDIN